MAFDLRFSTPRSRFAHPGARLGIITGFGGTSRWRSVVSPAIARRLFIANEVFSSSDALAGGLVDRVATDFSADFDRLAALDSKKVRALKELSRHSANLSQRQLVDLARLLDALYSG
jgi:enoyl-CoA hydratase/carnithine racemase